MKLEEAQRRAQQMRGWAEVKKEISDTGQALVVLDDRITELEGKLKIKHGLLEDCQKWMDYHNERADKAEAQRDRLVEACHGMLLSMDCEWENKNLGHDFADACRKVRTGLAKTKAGASDKEK